MQLNAAILKHEQTIEGWEYHNMAQELIRWIDIFNREYKLEIHNPCLALDKKSTRTLATYKDGYNEIGTRHEITLNVKHLNRPKCEILATLLHEMLHQWQELHGKPGKGNYHNQEYKDRATELGIPSDAQGLDLGIIKGGPFWRTLEREGVDLTEARLFDNDNPTKPEKKNTGASKLKKWICGCLPPQSARVSKKDFAAICPKCNQPFKTTI